LMRLLRGSGIAGLAAMARQSEREGVMLARPLLSVSKSQLLATLHKAKIAFADDPTNRDTAFTRARLRALLPQLAAEGGDAHSLARLAARLARANAAVEVLVDGAERYLALTGRGTSHHPHGMAFDVEAFAHLPEEIRLRLLMRAINRLGHEGPAELGKVEALLAALDRSSAEAAGPKLAQARLKQTLAGALVNLAGGRIRIEPAPARRRKAG
jgi:tRNA(Ile)-lysidine synthase